MDESAQVTFSIYAPEAEQVTLGLFSGGNTQEIPLTRSGDHWEARVPGVAQETLYAFKIASEWVLDPYAKEIVRSNGLLLGKVFATKDFDWEGDTPLHLPLSPLLIYEMHVRGFTMDPSSKVAKPGTFLGVVEKIPYLKQLGINAVELMPIHYFDASSGNYWGYSTQNFFAPMASYGSPEDFKQMVKELHRAGIEVILDVVYNHVGTGDFEKINRSTYFLLGDNQEHTNYSGCGNTFNSNHPKVMELILASLRYYVEEMHVDGFRFDLASIFCRGEKGEVLSSPPILRAIEECPALTHTKLIAEAWDCAGLFLVGSFPSKRFAEWNGHFRDRVRKFFKGVPHSAGNFATALCGSPDLYEGKKAPCQSINFITAHDGFTLRDLVSYNEKHNEANSEENCDGCDDNDSWNCGVEGETDDSKVLALREKQMRNFLLSLFMAVGTPMLLMGDEYGHTREGNNNAYCQDNQLNHFLWGEHPERVAFVQKLIQFRKSLPILQREAFLTDKEVTWHTPNWDENLVAYELHDANTHLFLAFNANDIGVTLSLPKARKTWIRKIDTAQEMQEAVEIDREYYLHPNASLLLSS